LKIEDWLDCRDEALLTFAAFHGWKPMLTVKSRLSDLGNSA
jgi:hypothetical protein